MAIKQSRYESAVYATGYLARWASQASDGRPHAEHGVVRNESGIASVHVEYRGPAGGPWTQILIADTVRDGRFFSLQQERTKVDWLKGDRSVKVVVGRWLRWLDEELM